MFACTFGSAMNVSFDRMKRPTHEKEKQYILNKIEFLLSAKRNETSPLKECIKRPQNIFATAQDIMSTDRIQVLKN